MWPEFPPLKFSNRIREFNCYSDRQRSAVVYNWLKNGMSTRQMDREIINIDPDSSKGYQSHGIYRYLGLTKKHQGFFRGWEDTKVVSYFHQLCSNPDYCIIFYYYLDHLDKQIISDNDIAMIKEIKIYQPENDLKAQTWIRNSWIGKTKEPINNRLLELPDIENGKEGKVLISKNHYAWYSNVEIKESIKDLYDFACQVCGEKILKTGWNVHMSRVDSWRYLSADVHHILPLSQGGPDRKDNMLCLCPTCHRKFHSGEFCLKEKNSKIILVNEMLGKKQELISKHHLVLY